MLILVHSWGTLVIIQGLVAWSKRGDTNIHAPDRKQVAGQKSEKGS